MSVGLKLDLRQSQSLVLTPQLQQAIKLLQLSSVELSAYVDRELAENPFLQAEARAAPTPPPAPASAAAPTARDDDDGWRPPRSPSAADARLGRDFAERGGEDDIPLEQRISRPASLAEHLIAQIGGVSCDDEARGALEAIAHLVDDNGYLRESDEDIAEMLGRAPEAIVAARAALQRMEPTGVGARSLRECLALQLAERRRLDPAMETLLDHLPALARADLQGLMRKCGVEEDDLREMIAEVRALDPKPGLAFGGDPIAPSPPDVIVAKSGDGWRVEVNPAAMPRVLVDESYFAEISAGCGDAEVKEYLSERHQAANWLVRALDQRARTLLRVSKAIFLRQRGFLERGPSGLRPLVLRDIAKAVNLHESTVSRATSEKFAATPRGVFPLRYFFMAGLAAEEGESASAEAVRQKIRSLIEKEDGSSVLSDDAIVKALKGDGVAIARRTVAKYREAMGIPSSVHRRRAKVLDR